MVGNKISLKDIHTRSVSSGCEKFRSHYAFLAKTNCSFLVVGSLTSHHIAKCGQGCTPTYSISTSLYASVPIKLLFDRIILK